MQAQPWSRIFLITNQFGLENFTNMPANTELVVVDAFQDTSLLTEQIKKQLDGKIADFEIALNLVSGSGKEHLAVLEAVLELGLNFRLVTWERNQLEVMGMKK